jgi:hypothetical protein
VFQSKHSSNLGRREYIPSSTKNINLDFYQDIRLQNGVSMEMLISQSSVWRLGDNTA